MARMNDAWFLTVFVFSFFEALDCWNASTHENNYRTTALGILAPPTMPKSTQNYTAQHRKTLPKLPKIFPWPLSIEVVVTGL